MSLGFRCELTLMVLGRYGYGQHVTDPLAFVLRCRKTLNGYHAMLRGDHQEVIEPEDAPPVSLFPLPYVLIPPPGGHR